MLSPYKSVRNETDAGNLSGRPWDVLMIPPTLSLDTRSRPPSDAGIRWGHDILPDDHAPIPLDSMRVRRSPSRFSKASQRGSDLQERTSACRER